MAKNDDPNQNDLPEENQSINIGGDFVGGDKVGGDQISVGNIAGSDVAIGKGATVISDDDEGDEEQRRFDPRQQQRGPAVKGAPSRVEVDDDLFEQMQQSSAAPSPPQQGLAMRSFARGDSRGDADQLDYERYAEVLASVVGSPLTRPPLTVGIYAAWGMGKTFLMDLVRRRLTASSGKPSPANADAPPVDFVFVEYNAWVYSEAEDLWAGLISRLYESVEGHIGAGRAARFRLGQNLWRSLGRILGVLAIYGILALVLSLFVDFNAIRLSWQSLADSVKALTGALVGGSALTLFSTLPTLVKAVRELWNSVILSRTEQLIDLAARPNFKEQFGMMAEVQREIDFMLKLIRRRDKRAGHETRLIIFIDDLDRLKPEKAVEVLQAIMLLLAYNSDLPFVIFLGIDARVVVRAIEDFYGRTLVDAGITGYEYLDKIVQIPFRIPSANQAELARYVGSLLHSTQAMRSREAGTRSGDLSDPSQAKEDTMPLLDVEFTSDEEHVFRSFTPYLLPNPRRIKRMVNVYRLIRMLPGFDPADLEMHVKWIILTEQWPYRASWMLQRMEDDMQRNTGFAHAMDESLTSLVDAVRPHMTGDDVSRFVAVDGDPEMFEAFAESQPYMSCGDVARMAGWSFNLNPALRSEVLKMASGDQPASA